MVRSVVGVACALLIVVASACGETPPANAPVAVDALPQAPADPTTLAVAPSSAGGGASPEAIVSAHNRARATHCAPPLSWSPKLAASASQWAETLRQNHCGFDHSNTSYGENLAAGSAGSLDADGIVKMWFDEGALYNFATGGFSADTGHFTQVVWRGTREVGCGHAQCNGNDIWVCQYDPPGNFEGQYQQQVLPSSCKR